ncbi:hypothetical protein MACK_002874 [Theileria orientalis]|uniref:Uncharacterized protein n=1 Tax=Theileria orientalis TaxID=68886 RepID=A0A976MED6_THEOR|nr:hypothetical protein MACK_002874 [Theileria orientalis]
MDSSRLSEFLIQRDGFELIKVTEDEYNESLRFIESPDAIMDDSVFYHIKKVISYLFCKDGLKLDKDGNIQEIPDDKTRNSEYAKQLNRTVLNTLVDGYVGYAWLCEVCSRWIDYLLNSGQDQDYSDYKEKRLDSSKTIIHDALMSFLTSKYDTDRMRVYMEDKLSHDSWNPPELYWNLMKSPLVVSHMLKIYRDKPKDEFLSSWYQDYMNNFSSHMKMEQSEVNKEGLSRITSNFSVFTLRISEEIHKFLLRNETLDSIDYDNLDAISPLFCHAENAYIYSQALLHFIYRWRIDLRGCRRLSQLIARATMYPNDILRESQTNVDYSTLEWSVSQIHLLMTNFSRFPALHSTFKRLASTQKSAEKKFNHHDVCDFYEELMRTLKAFDSYGFLLFDNRAPPKIKKDEEEEQEIIIDESVSQFGDKRQDEYMRLGNTPEMPPLEAIRESNLLNALIEDFSNREINITDSSTWIKYANLLVLLSVLSPYELLYNYYYEKVCDYIKMLPQREVWQQFYLPPEESDTDDSIESIERFRDFGNYDNEEHYSESQASSITSSDDCEIKTDTHIHKAWDSEPSNSILSSNIFSPSSSNHMSNNSRLQSSSSIRLSDKSSGAYEINNRTSDDSMIEDVRSEYMEIKSTLESAIYKNINEQSKLGPGKNISKERLDEMKQLYSQFKVKSEKLMSIARKELYQLYKLIHNQQDMPESEYEMRNLTTTNIAASVIMSYITQRVIKTGNISQLCDVKLMLLKQIADKHPVKRNSIVLLLRDLCKMCVIGSMEECSNKLERMEAIVDLLVYMSRFEKQCILIIAMFDTIMNVVDRSICRVFITKMLKFCGPPYSEEFSLQFIKLVDKFISIGNGGVQVQSDIESTLMNKFINPFIQECLQNNFNNQELIQTAKRCDVKNDVQYQ